MELHKIPYKVSYRAVKYPRLEFKTGELLFVLPFGHKPDALLAKHKGWILKKVNFIRECLADTSDKELIFREDEKFRRLIHSIVKKTSKELDVKLNGIYFREMRTKWASLSPRKNLTINTLMKYLPEYLIRYVIFHETAHLIEKRHNNRFWKLILRKYKNYQAREREMFIYWFLISKNLAEFGIGTK
ncbi:MAG TPA: hypothetical protein DEP99_03520 [Nitrospiraceae bacterium]|nr:hypothetical protein [Nitrospiraceae bacterium]